MATQIPLQHLSYHPRPHHGILQSLMDNLRLHDDKLSMHLEKRQCKVVIMVKSITLFVDVTNHQKRGIIVFLLMVVVYL